MNICIINLWKIIFHYLVYLLAYQINGYMQNRVLFVWPKCLWDVEIILNASGTQSKEYLDG